MKANGQGYLFKIRRDTKQSVGVLTAYTKSAKAGKFNAHITIGVDGNACPLTPMYVGEGNIFTPATAVYTNKGLYTDLSYMQAIISGSIEIRDNVITDVSDLDVYVPKAVLSDSIACDRLSTSAGVHRFVVGQNVIDAYKQGFFSGIPVEAFLSRQAFFSRLLRR